MATYAHVAHADPPPLPPPPRAHSLFRVEQEVKQNADTLRKDLAGAGEEVKFGEVYQFQHLVTGKFLDMRLAPAAVNTGAQRVTVDGGSEASYFRIMPRFKMRSLGFPVFADDEVVLESGPIAGFCLSAQHRFAYPQALADPAQHVVPPRVLRTPRTLELNGSIREVASGRKSSAESESHSSFCIKFFGRFDEQSALTTMHSFRLWHPESDCAWTLPPFCLYLLCCSRLLSLPLVP